MNNDMKKLIQLMESVESTEQLDELSPFSKLGKMAMVGIGNKDAEGNPGGDQGVGGKLRGIENDYRYKGHNQGLSPDDIKHRDRVRKVAKRLGADVRTFEDTEQLDELSPGLLNKAADAADDKAEELYNKASNWNPFDKNREKAAKKELQAANLRWGANLKTRKPPVTKPSAAQNESIHKIYRNTDGSATVVMESGAAYWYDADSVQGMLNESGKIDRSKL